MTQEEKQLLLKVLCEQLPYWDLRVQYNGKDYSPLGYSSGRVILLDSPVMSFVSECPPIEEVKLYLRSMSSMTNEEYSDLCVHCSWVWHNDSKDLTKIRGDYKCYDWLNAHHFDYRRLIKKGLALEAPKDMYKTE